MCMNEPATSGYFSSVIYLGRSFKARLVAKIGVVWENRKLSAISANSGFRFSRPTNLMNVSTGLTFEAMNFRALITVPSSSTTAVAWPFLTKIRSAPFASM